MPDFTPRPEAGHEGPGLARSDNNLFPDHSQPSGSLAAIGCSILPAIENISSFLIPGATALKVDINAMDLC